MPKSTKTTANSLANFVYNLLGYLPAPYVYGLVYDNTGGGKSIWGMFALECAGMVAVFLMIALLIRQKREEAIINKTKENLHEPLRDSKLVKNLSEYD